MKKNKLFLLLCCLSLVISLDCRAGFDMSKIYNDFTPMNYKTVKWSKVFPMLDRGEVIVDGSRLIEGSSCVFLKTQIKLSNYFLLWAEMAKNLDTNGITDTYDAEARLADALTFRQCVLKLIEYVSNSDISKNTGKKLTIEDINSLKDKFKEELYNAYGYGCLSDQFKFSYEYILKNPQILYIMLRCDYGYLLQLFNPSSNDTSTSPPSFIAPPLQDSDKQLIKNGFYTRTGPFAYFSSDEWSYFFTQHGPKGQISNLFGSKRTYSRSDASSGQSSTAEIGIFYPFVYADNRQAGVVFTRYNSYNKKWELNNYLPWDKIEYQGKAKNDQPGNYFLLSDDVYIFAGGGTETEDVTKEEPVTPSDTNLEITDPELTFGVEAQPTGETGCYYGPPEKTVTEQVEVPITSNFGTDKQTSLAANKRSSEYVKCTLLFLNITKDMLPENSNLGQTFNSAGLNVIYNYMITGNSTEQNNY